MYIDIYFNAESNIERDLLEERLDEILKGKGEVTGGGAGKDGVNIDIDWRWLWKWRNYKNNKIRIN